MALLETRQGPRGVVLSVKELSERTHVQVIN